MDDPPSPTAPTAVADEVFAAAAPAIPSLELRVAKARAESALFGANEAVKIGRYRILDRIGAGGMGVVWSAFDPELGRAVALKLASSGSAAARARARDEGRALARLSHPNVVPIYDVLEHDDRVFLVMELVKGDNLRAAHRARTATQIVRDYRQAGDGLAAAHAAGLIHRDFKPDNAILGADGRVRVLDFGLAHAADGGDGGIAGTPGYMAPEQERGEPLTAAVDQFALCVALRETLTARGGVARWLAPILDRGAAAQADARFPSMEALLAALARDPATRWKRRLAIGGGALALAGIGGAFVLGRTQQAPAIEACSGGPALIAPSFGPAQRAAIVEALGKMTGGYARDSAPRILSALDHYRASWLTLHHDACMAHERRELSDELYDRRVGCLHRPRAALAAAAALAATATASDLPGLVQAIGALPEIDACADDAALQAGVAPPPSSVRAEVDTVDALLSQVDVVRDAGKVADAQLLADRAVRRADALGYPPLDARAHLARGRVTLEARRDDFGAADFDQAMRQALPVGGFAIAVEAYARRAFAIAMTVASPRELDQAIDGLSTITALGQWLGRPGAFPLALLYNNLGAVARRSGDVAMARRAYQFADQLSGALVGAAAIELTSARLNLMQVTDDAIARVALGDATVATLTAQLGPTHPSTLRARCLVAKAAADPGRAYRELGPVIATMTALHPQQADTTANCAMTLMWTAALLDDLPTSQQAATLVLAGTTAAPPALAQAYLTLAAGDVDQARRQFADLLTTVGSQSLAVALDAAIGGAIATRRAGDRASLERQLAALDALVAQAAGEAPPALTQMCRAARRALDDDASP